MPDANDNDRAIGSVVRVTNDVSIATKRNDQLPKIQNCGWATFLGESFQ